MAAGPRCSLVLSSWLMAASSAHSWRSLANVLLQIFSKWSPELYLSLFLPSLPFLPSFTLLACCHPSCLISPFFSFFYPSCLLLPFLPYVTFLAFCHPSCLLPPFLPYVTFLAFFYPSCLMSPFLPSLPFLPAATLLALCHLSCLLLPFLPSLPFLPAATLLALCHLSCLLFTLLAFFHPSCLLWPFLVHIQSIFLPCAKKLTSAVLVFTSNYRAVGKCCVVCCSLKWLAAMPAFLPTPLCLAPADTFVVTASQQAWFQ